MVKNHPLKIILAREIQSFVFRVYFRRGGGLDPSVQNLQIGFKILFFRGTLGNELLKLLLESQISIGQNHYQKMFCLEKPD